MIENTREALIEMAIMEMEGNTNCTYYKKLKALVENAQR